MKQRPTRFTALLIIALIVTACVGGRAFAGLNANAKVSVHVIPHASRSCTKSFPSIAACGDIIYTEAAADVDAFPVFFDLVEYQGLDYGLDWPGMYTCTFTSCSDLTIGGIVNPGDGISHAWTTCQSSGISIPGWGWMYDNGLICVVPHPLFGHVNAGDCQGGTTPDSIPADRIFCAGIGGTAGTDPCAQPPVCQVFPTSLDFNSVMLGDPPETRTFAITNTGGGNLEGTLSETCDHYSITDPPGGGVYSVPSGDSLVVTVEYDPTVGGMHLCNIDTGTPCADDVACTGRAVVPVYVDIRPGSCPNDLRPESPFMIPVAILGTASFDVMDINPSSIELTRQGVAGSVSPVRWAYNDVGTPYMGALCGCHKLGADTHTDLNLKFRISDVVAALELDAVPGQTVELTVTGTLTGGSGLVVAPTFIGADCVRVLSGLHGVDLPGSGIGLVPHGKIGEDTQISLSFYTDSEDRIALEIFDVRGRLVTRLVDEVMAPGVYDRTWDRKDDAGRRVPAGVYFARLRNSVEEKTAKVVIVN